MKLHKNLLIKITSSILCLVLTAQAGWALSSVRVNAAGVMSVDDTGKMITLTTDGLASANYDITYNNTSHSYAVKCDNPAEGSVDNLGFFSVDTLRLGGWAYVSIKTDIEAKIEFMSGEYDDANLQIESGNTLTCNGISGHGHLINYGTLKIDTFRTSDLSSLESLTNSGTIIADKVEYNRSDLTMFDSGTFRVTTSFTNSGTGFSGTVIAESEDTLIKSNGGSFTLKYGTYSKTISGTVNDIAANLLYEDPQVNLNSPRTVYYGTDPKFEQGITVAGGYTGTPYIEYSRYNDPVINTTRPTAVGTDYEVRAVAPRVSGYKEGKTLFRIFDIEYLPLTSVSSAGKYYTLEGIVNDRYVPDKVTVIPASGFQIASSVNPQNGFADSLSIGRNDVLNADGTLKDSVTFTFRRTGDGAQTEPAKISSMTSSPSFTALVFDEYDPSIGGEMADGREISIDDGDTVVADELSFYVYDDNLDKVTVDGKTYTGSDFEDGVLDVTLESVVASPRVITLTATDKADKVFSLSFTLRHTTVDPETAKVSVPDSYVGDAYEPEVTTDSDGAISFYYKDDNAAGEDYSSSKPSAAGGYSVKAVIAGTVNYYEAVCYDTFTIRKRTPAAEVTVPDTIINERYEPALKTDSDGAEDTVFEYKVQGAPDSTYAADMPSGKGTYTVRATIPETERYLGATCTSDFTIRVKQVTATVSVNTPFAGTTYSPVITTESDGKGDVIYEYKEAGAPDSAYTSERPDGQGSYIVRATIPETDVYGRIVCTARYDIVFLPAPDKAYSLEGTAGNNDYFVSDVELKAPDGFVISSEFRGEYGKSVTYSDDLNVVYLRRISDGALTSAVAVELRPSIDKETPSFSSSVGSIATDDILFVNDMTLTASDENLVSLTVNGVAVDLENEGSIMTLTPGFGIKTFVITAEDIAGNVSTIEFTLMAEWLRDRIIPAGVLLPLVKNEPYNLDSGKWTVNDDKTVYNGNIPIYVNENGDYTFTKVS